MNHTKTIWRIDPVHSRLRFDVKYLMVTTISGWFRELEGTVIATEADFNNSEIALTVYTNALYTGVDERDAHVRSADFFDVKKYPTIRFWSDQVHAGDEQLLINGTLLIKGKEHPVQLKAVYHGSMEDAMGNQKAAFELDFAFDRKDFDISWNEHFDKHGVLISDKVTVHADIQLLKIRV